jgi:tRNA(fMet)-specific endonuclease VapC
MTLWILDTDHISLLQRNDPNVRQRLVTMNPNEIFVTVVTFEEQIRGRLSQVKKAGSKELLISGYDALRETIEDYKSLNLLDFNEAAYSCYMDLLRQKIRVGTQDLRIAAIALSVSGIVVTRNQKDFGKVPNLQIENWAHSDIISCD